MPATHRVTIGERTVTVRELTVREVRDWALRVDAGLIPLDAVGQFALPDCTLSDLIEMSDATAELLDDLAPSELEQIAEVARKLNPHFFKLRAALSGAAQVLIQEARQHLSTAPA
jgi:hypothetical protein